MRMLFLGLAAVLSAPACALSQGWEKFGAAQGNGTVRAGSGWIIGDAYTPPGSDTTTMRDGSGRII